VEVAEAAAAVEADMAAVVIAIVAVIVTSASLVGKT